MADASTMLRTINRLTALSLGTSTPDASHLTRLTCRRVTIGTSSTRCKPGHLEGDLCITADRVQARYLDDQRGTRA